MKTLEDSVWVVVMVVGFAGGCVANIVDPSRRGAWGFAGAALIGIFCGGVAGISANLFGVSTAGTVLITAVSAVLGDRILSAILLTRSQHNYNVHGGQNVFGRNDGGQHTDGGQDE